MPYLKCAVVGMLAGAVTAIVLPIALTFSVFQAIVASGQGGLGSVSVGIPTIVLSWFIGFALGFYLMLRRQRRLLAGR